MTYVVAGYWVDGYVLEAPVTPTTQYPGAAGGVRKSKRRILVKDEELTPKQFRAVVQRVARVRPKLEPDLEQIASDWARVEVAKPTYPNLPVYDYLAEYFGQQQKWAELEMLQKLAADLADDEDVEILVLYG